MDRCGICSSETHDGLCLLCKQNETLASMQQRIRALERERDEAVMFRDKAYREKGEQIAACKAEADRIQQAGANQYKKGVRAGMLEAAQIAYEQRCERGTDWDRACVAIAVAIRKAAEVKR